MSRDDPPARGQQQLALQFARIAAALRGESVPEAIAGPPRLTSLAAALRLSAFERDLLICLAGLEVDSAVAAAAGDGVNFARALERLPAPHWSAVEPMAPLRRWRMIDLDPAAPLLQGRLRIDERILHHLIGFDPLDARLAGIATIVAPPAMAALSQAALAAELLDQIAASAEPPAVVLYGDDADGMEDVAAAIAPALLGIETALLPAAPAEMAALAVLIDREAVLRDAVPFLRATDSLAESALRLADGLARSPIVAARVPSVLRRATLRRRVDRPNSSERFALWQHHAPALDASTAARLAGTFRLSARTIAQEARLDPGSRRIEAACRDVGGAELAGLAERLAPGKPLDALVLPAPIRATLDRIVAQMQQRPLLDLAWRDTEMTGLVALFAGDSGTGKTMAARAVAATLGLDLYRVDLASTVSKYIGETEKNIRSLFAAAEASGAVLLFDEADALFGKRSEVRDAHDRYANIETGYLLQRLETYSGLAILTTNMRHALDPAFQRRLRFVLTFPFPDAAARAAIWRGAFPAEVATHGLDFSKLARLECAGGAIRVIALNAAYAAADEGAPLDMRHLLAAARADAAKRERPLSDSETRGWT